LIIADHLAWRTSSRSSNGENCVEVASTVEGAVIPHSATETETRDRHHRNRRVSQRTR
jgi:hypothetical protein